ncbi:MAG: phosphoesterase [Bacteroidia bacterium]|nr:MAG: phosphoesterase [Bacteroidia bacterium]
MTKVFLFSDTHSHWNDEWNKHIQNADELWHAGDIGDEEFLNKLKSISVNKKLRIVYGNIDNHNVRTQTQDHLIFELENFKILIIHIAGTFGKYNPQTQKLILQHQPDILVCGHSHILKIKWDEKYKLWYINPGAAGKYGFHKVSTALLFELNDSKISNMQIIEWKK